MNIKEVATVGSYMEPISCWVPERDNPEGTFTYIDLSAIDNDAKLITAARSIRGKDAPSRARQIVHAGDVLVSTVRPNLNGVAQIPAELDGATASTGFCVLRPVKGRLNSRYLFHWVRSSRFIGEMVKKAAGASYPAVSDRIIYDSNLPVVGQVEQRRIAEILDKADALRAKRRVALAELDSLTQSIFLDAFGNPAINPRKLPMCRIGDLLAAASYGTSEKAGTEGEFPVLRMNNITSTGEIDLSDLKYMDLNAGLYDRYLVRKGDVLFNRTNSAELVGKTAIFREEQAMAYAGYLIRLRVNDENDPEYLSAFLNTAYAKKILRGMCKSIIGMANINAKEVQGIKIARPSLDEQREFAHRILTVDGIRKSVRAHLAQLDSLFMSLQQRAFNGRL